MLAWQPRDFVSLHSQYACEAYTDLLPLPPVWDPAFSGSWDVPMKREVNNIGHLDAISRLRYMANLT